MRQITILVLAFACFGAFLTGRSEETFETDGGENSQLENVIVGGNDMDDDFNEKEDPINDFDKADSSVIPLHGSIDEETKPKRSPFFFRRPRLRVPRFRVPRLRIPRFRVPRLRFG